MSHGLLPLAGETVETAQGCLNQVGFRLEDEGTTNPDKFALNDRIPGLGIRAEVADAVTGANLVLDID